MKNINRISCLLLAVSLLFCSCKARHNERPVNGKTSTTAADTTTTTTTTTTTVDPVKSRTQELIGSMTLEEKVGQLFMVFPETLSGIDTYVGLNDGIGKKAVVSASGEIKAAIQKYHIGGVIMFAQNIVSPNQINAFNRDLQSASKIPLFISVDEEGGFVARLAGNKNFNLPKYSSAAAVGSTGKEADAFKMGESIGAYLKQYGFNIDFAPVADVNSNPNNPIIGRRSFSANPTMASKLSGSAAKGLISKGIMPTFKHFPGHGDTAEDSHVSLAVNNHNLDRLMKDDWLPYINNDLNHCAVMVGHIALPNVTGHKKSAALDENVVNDYLRNKLGFEGLVITDSLKMQGVTNYYETGEAAVMAINAGCDIILMPQNFVKSYNAVLEAVKNGKITQERLNKSLERILSEKVYYGIAK
ncbi:MAG: glycoside hydrolase family 3 protein [Clostridia bacterium]|nr:glycoside hydrolase family 3 protein [Clostridia bacterium]